MTDDEKREKWARLVDYATHVEVSLVAYGVDAEFAANIAEVIRHKAGSYLPPVHGILKLKFDDADLRT